MPVGPKMPILLLVTVFPLLCANTGNGRVSWRIFHCFSGGVQVFGILIAVMGEGAGSNIATAGAGG
ncbi:MAG: hypothetical protein CMK32_14830 [Porticoccaceae bacterium]|nr:hypothetical protein [Porticoccaceae bacterium]